MIISGPYVTHTVLVVECREELDPGAYWNLDFDGELLDGNDPLTLLYAKAAYPTLAAAQHQFRIEREALELRRQPGRNRVLQRPRRPRKVQA